MEVLSISNHDFNVMLRGVTDFVHREKWAGQRKKKKRERDRSDVTSLLWEIQGNSVSLLYKVKLSVRVCFYVRLKLKNKYPQSWYFLNHYCPG